MQLRALPIGRRFFCELQDACAARRGLGKAQLAAQLTQGNFYKLLTVLRIKYLR
jgi:hypothetical protein